MMLNAKNRTSNGRSNLEISTDKEMGLGAIGCHSSKFSEGFNGDGLQNTLLRQIHQPLVIAACDFNVPSRAGSIAVSITLLSSSVLKLCAIESDTH